MNEEWEGVMSVKFFKKNKISNEEFSAFLFVSLARSMNNEAMKKATEVFGLSPNEDDLFGLRLENSDERNLLFKELLALNMWIISSCSDYGRHHKDKIEILNGLHGQVYHLLVSKLGYFSSWQDFIEYVNEKYRIYNKIMKESDAKTVVSNLATEIYRNINKRGYSKKYSASQISEKIISYTRALSSLWMNLIDNPKLV